MLALTDEQGQATDRLNFDAWGVPKEGTDFGTSGNRFAFTSHRFDTELDLYYAGGRMYSPTIGRFISQDTLGLDPNNPDTWNLFSYARSNPTRYVDPTGHAAEDGQPPAWLVGVVEGGQDFIERAQKVPEQVAQGFARLLTPGALENKGEVAERQRQFLAVAKDPKSPFVARVDAAEQALKLQPGVIVEEAVVRPLQEAPGHARAAGVHLAQAATTTNKVDQAVHLLEATKETSEAFTGFAAPLALASGRPKAAAAVPEEALASRAFRAAETVADELAPVVPSSRAAVRLNVLNPEFTPDPTKVLQNITTAQADALAANPSLARSVLSRREYLAGQTSESVARMQYGNAVERLVKIEIEKSPLHSKLFEHFGGPNNPDFAGRGAGLAWGEAFEITTPQAVPRHLARPYGPGLNVVTYQRPPLFRLFP